MESDTINYQVFNYKITNTNFEKGSVTITYKYEQPPLFYAVLLKKVDRCLIRLFDTNLVHSMESSNHYQKSQNAVYYFAFYEILGFSTQTVQLLSY